MNKTIRTGKIHGRHQQVAGHYNGGRDVAWLNVSGLWLEQAGFKVGDGIVIEVQDGQLVIKKQRAHGNR
ncbi:SymE family type I addiction module toxin [Chitinophaga sp. GCM10012297]|uniref:SymE family type I addiction module toxin n=1 Tax=Chitinophaga chungangae TaxID=2821488 RepID=A0ABS3YHB7_9BACT|nr:SymE family type I addiction module toxin [Chitinophaga chungangae]MBO9154081.1 SymE family type I addiction module toxin [Chitinophaga chungangae]